MCFPALFFWNDAALEFEMCFANSTLGLNRPNGPNSSDQNMSRIQKFRHLKLMSFTGHPSSRPKGNRYNDRQESVLAGFDGGHTAI